MKKIKGPLIKSSLKSLCLELEGGLPLFTHLPRRDVLGNSVNRGNGGGCLGLASIFLISLVPPPPRPPAHILLRYCIYEACDEA